MATPSPRPHPPHQSLNQSRSVTQRQGDKSNSYEQRPSDHNFSRSSGSPGKYSEHQPTRHDSTSTQHVQRRSERSSTHHRSQGPASRGAIERSQNTFNNPGSSSQIPISRGSPLGQAVMELPPADTSDLRNPPTSQRDLVKPTDSTVTLNDSNMTRVTAVEDAGFLKYINTFFTFATGPKKARDTTPVHSFGEISSEALGHFKTEESGSQQQESDIVPVGQLKESDILIALMGPTGVGKSSFIGKATGRDDIGIGHDLQSCTDDVRAIRVQVPETDENIILVDTPGFDDTHKTDYEILELIAKWLKTTGSRNIRLRGVLYLHRITDNRMAGTPLRCLDLFQKICGPKWFDRVVLVTTKWDEVERVDLGEMRETELKSDFWKVMIDQGSRTIRHHNSHDSAWKILKLLLDAEASLPEEKAAQQKHVLKLQKETADKGKALPKTDAGFKLYSQINELERRRKGFIETLDKQIADSHVDTEYKHILQDQRSQMQQESKAATDDLGSLRLPTAQRLIKSFKSKWLG